MEGITKSGFKFKVDERVRTDWRFTMALTKMENQKKPMGVLQGINELVELLLGDQMEAFINHIKEQNEGFVPMEIVTDELKQIIEQFPKNS